MTNTTGGIQAPRVAILLLSAAVLAWFLSAYGPAEPGLRGLILAVGILIAAAAAFRPAWGLAAFVFLLLTANNWPYYFQSRHGVFYVRVAAILFLFLAAGWNLRRAVVRRESETDGEASLPAAVGRPLGFAAAVIVISAGVAFWRWANFYPVWGNGVFDWMTNSNGLFAALARRGAVMSAAGYLLPFAFLAIAAKTMKTRAGVEPVLRAASLGLGLAVVFGYVQHFASPGLGNTDFWVKLGQINGTFIDPNAYGAVLAILIPMVFAAAVDGWAKAKGIGKAGGWPAAAAAVAGLGTVAFLWIGARSSVLAFAAGMAVFAVGAFVSRKKDGTRLPAGTDDASREAGAGHKKRTLRRRWMAAAAIVLLVSGGGLFFRSRLFVRLKDRTRMAAATGDLLLLSPERYFLWKHALAMTRDYPVSGVGVGAFIVVLPDYYQLDKTPAPAGFEGYQRLDSAENFFLQAAAETGLIGLAAWIAVWIGLAWKIRRAVLAGILRGSDRWLFLGAVGGLTGFFVNALFHSFTQSFETMFCFCLAAAVVVVLGPRQEGGATPHLGRPALLLLVLLLLLIVFGASSFRDSSRSLSIAAKSEAFGLSQEFGLYRPEQDENGTPFRWTKDEAAWTVEVTGRTLRLPVRISHPDAAAERPVRVKVSIGKYLLRDEVLLGEAVWTESGRKVLEFPLPAGYGGRATIRLVVDRTWVPSAKDPRRLGAAVEPAPNSFKQLNINKMLRSDPNNQI